MENMIITANEKDNGDIKLSNMTPRVFNVFDLLGFPLLYEITGDAAEAVRKFLAALGGNRGHVCHTSSRGALELLRPDREGPPAGDPGPGAPAAPEAGEAAPERPLTCEVTPHHLLLDAKEHNGLGTMGKMNPPLRTREHREALWAAFVDGRIDCLASDHAPHLEEEKDTGFAEFLELHRSLYETTVTRIQTLMDREAHLEWFAAFFGEHPQATFTLAPGLLNGGSCYGARCREPGGKDHLYCILGVWKTDAHGLPQFTQEIMGTVVHEFAHSFANPVAFSALRQSLDMPSLICL